MFRPMRRKSKEIGAEAAEALLVSARRGVLAVNGDGGYPYAVPINYYYDGETRKIYFHGSRAGHKADALKKNEKVCFSVTGEEMIRDEAWAPYLQSVVVFGLCHPVTEPEKAGVVLRKFAMKYYPDEQTAQAEIEASGKAVQMYEIMIEHISGKEIQEK